MRVWHFLFATLLVAVILAIARDPVGRVALIVFFTAIGLLITGTSSVMLLFRAVAGIGAAESAGSYLEALAATAGVVFFGSFSMLFVLWCGFGLITQVLP